MNVITVHGIRRGRNRWNESFSQLKSVRDNRIQVDPFDFGNFGFIKFFTPFIRDRIVDRFCEFYSDKYSSAKQPPSIIAHSFGTYVVLKAMEKYPSIKFDKIFFCGSILNTDTDFRKLLSLGQFQKLLNYCGSNEFYLFLTRILINEYCGRAGKKGFLDIPRNQTDRVVNIPHSFGHGDYFLPLQMDSSWVKELLKSRERHKYKQSILSNKIIDRIYENINSSEFPFEIKKVSYNARIDADKKYYAKTMYNVYNSSQQPIDSYTFCTTADGTVDGEEMNFAIFDGNNLSIEPRFAVDLMNHKVVVVYLNSLLIQGGELTVSHYFYWGKTMTFNGDTDHFAIKNVPFISIQLNFPYKLNNVRFYVICEKEVVENYTPTIDNELDGTYTYRFNYENLSNSDGIIFYYEGHSKNNPRVLQKIQPNKSNRKDLKELLNPKNNNLIIEKVTIEDIPAVYEIEKRVELSNAAEEKTLLNRRLMFNDGFLVIKSKGKVVGYIESLLWNRKPFTRFKDISNFPLFFNVKGLEMYVIFLAVDPSARKKGFARKLMTELEKVAKKYKVEKMTLVAKDNLVEFYQNQGYSEISELPEFLENKSYKSIFMEKTINVDVENDE